MRVELDNLYKVVLFICSSPFRHAHLETSCATCTFVECYVLLQAVGVMNQLALELDINSAVDNIRDVVLELLNCERVTLFLVDNQQKELR